MANYVEAIGFEKQANRIVAANVQDRLTGNRFPIRAKLIVNTSGPWVDVLLNR